VSDRLFRKVALISGGAAGIGRATSLLFAREGAAIAVMDRDLVGATACAHEIVEFGGHAIAFQADVTRFDDAQRVVLAIETQLGGLDILVNNAGVIGRGTVETTKEDEWDRVIDVNLTGTFLMSKAAIPAIRRRKAGSIINVSSAAGLAGWRNQAAYVASKGAVVNLTRNMALDYAREGIRVNCLIPAHVNTPMSQAYQAVAGHDGERLMAEVTSTIPLGRFSEPEEVAYAALFLASEESSYVTGSMLVVDGGYLAQ